MATATVMDIINNIRTVPYTHSAATSPGDIIVGNGAVLVAVNKKDANAENAYVYEGKVELPKQSGLAINAMDAVFWDNTNSYINKTSTGNTACGHCVESAGASATKVVILLRSYVKV